MSNTKEQTDINEINYTEHTLAPFVSEMNYRVQGDVKPY